MLQLHVHCGGQTPIHRQIEDQIVAAIRAERLRPGERLAPSSEVAERLVASPRTVERAYLELELAGLCRRDGDGFRVVSPRWPAAAAEEPRRPMNWQRLLRDLEGAGDVQRRLLPPQEVEGDGFAVAARTSPAGFVSGDFFDIHALAGGGVGVVVGDVAGKGLGAGLVTGTVRTALRFLSAERSVEETLAELNRRLFAELDRRSFVALAYARYTPRRGRLEIANAGLPDPYLMRPGGAPETVVVPGPRLPLGLRSGVEYRALGLPLGRGERLLMLSDGIPEARTAAGEPLGYEAMARLLAATSPTGEPQRPGCWLDLLMAAVRSATAAEREDDWTALVLESCCGRRRTWEPSDAPARSSR